MKPIQFVWFTGHSAVGKQQTIRQCLEDPSWAETTFGLQLADGMQQLRVNQLTESGLKGISGCVLLKWQKSTDGEIQRLHKERPADRHVVILLVRETEEHFKGFTEKFQQVYSDDPEQLATYIDPEAARRKFLNDRTINEATARASGHHADAFLEFRIENGLYQRIESPTT